MRMRKKKNAQSRMSACADIMIQNPTVLKGKWDELYGKGRQIFLEIGCGKGSFITQLAKQNPDNFYIALEVVPDVIMLAMEKAIKLYPSIIMYSSPRGFSFFGLSDFFSLGAAFTLRSGATLGLILP